MSNNTNPESLDGNQFQAEPRRTPLGNLLEALAQIYQEVGLPPSVARRAAVADLESNFRSLAVAA